MGRPVKLYPGSDATVFDMPFWCDIYEDPNAEELWIDFHHFWSNSILFFKPHDLSSYIPPKIDKAISRPARNIVFYDWFHGRPDITNEQIEWVQSVARKKPVTWITLNPKPVPGVKTIRFDYYWNRSKRAFLDQLPFHKVNNVKNYVQYPMHTNPRSKKFLTYHSRVEPVREIVRNHLINNYDGFYNDPEKNQWLFPNVFDTERYCVHSVSPPARLYYDESYVTCLVETQYRGSNSHLVSEKTYDNLLQGRGVMNFATPGFHHDLQARGWKLPHGIDWSWDLIVNDQQRLDRYLLELDKLFSLSNEHLHQWFISNMECWQNNRRMLYKKPYDIIDLNQIKIQ